MMPFVYPVAFIAVSWSLFRAVAVVYRVRHGKWPWDHGEWPFQDRD